VASMPSRAAAADAVTSRAADASTFEAEISPLLGAARRRHRRFASGGWSQAGGGEGLIFADALHGWIFNGAGLWATTDSGTTWQYQPVIGPVPGYGS
jgi:hypothetical protein